MQQQRFTDLECYNRKKQSKREKFLSQMDKIILWQKLLEPIQPITTVQVYQEDTNSTFSDVAYLLCTTVVHLIRPSSRRNLNRQLWHEKVRWYRN